MKYPFVIVINRPHRPYVICLGRETREEAQATINRCHEAGSDLSFFSIKEDCDPQELADKLTKEK